MSLNCIYNWYKIWRAPIGSHYPLLLRPKSLPHKTFSGVFATIAHASIVTAMHKQKRYIHATIVTHPIKLSHLSKQIKCNQLMVYQSFIIHHALVILLSLSLVVP